MVKPGAIGAGFRLVAARRIRQTLVVRLVGLLAGALMCACASGSGASLDAGLGDGAAGADSSDPLIDASPDQPDASASSADASTTDAPTATIDAAVVPDAMIAPPDAAPADACSPGWIQLLGNGDFESGNTVWTATSNGGDVIRMGSSPWPPQGGSWQALFLGYNSASQSLTQTVTIPAGATALRLRGYRCFVTNETASVPYDNLTIELKQGAALLETLAAYSNVDAGTVCSWTALQVDASSAHAGQTVTLKLLASSDSATATSFGLDTLVLEAFGCP
jgi:hypothetical protein